MPARRSAQGPVRGSGTRAGTSCYARSWNRRIFSRWSAATAATNAVQPPSGVDWRRMRRRGARADPCARDIAAHPRRRGGESGGLPAPAAGPKCPGTPSRCSGRSSRPANARPGPPNLVRTHQRRRSPDSALARCSCEEGERSARMGGCRQCVEMEGWKEGLGGCRSSAVGIRRALPFFFAVHAIDDPVANGAVH